VSCLYGGCPGDVVRVGEHGPCDLAQTKVVASRVGADQHECVVDADAASLGKCTFGLLDRDAAVQCPLQLLGEHSPAAAGPLLQQADGRDISQRLHDLDIGFDVACPRFGPLRWWAWLHLLRRESAPPGTRVARLSPVAITAPAADHATDQRGVHSRRSCCHRPLCAGFDRAYTGPRLGRVTFLLQTSAAVKACRGEV